MKLEKENAIFPRVILEIKKFPDTTEFPYLSSDSDKECFIDFLLFAKNNYSTVFFKYTDKLLQTLSDSMKECSERKVIQKKRWLQNQIEYTKTKER
jgi:hypothetical protein